jgi:hypothetical protein
MRTEPSTEPSKTLSIEDAKHPPVPRHEHMVVVVGVTRTPEALREGDGSELRVAK